MNNELEILTIRVKELEEWTRKEEEWVIEQIDILKERINQHFTLISNNSENIGKMIRNIIR